MDTRQLTFSDLLYGKIKASHKPYAKKILNELYPDKKLNQLDILAKFSNKHLKIVKASIKDLEECSLIININGSNLPRSEKQYILTKSGKRLVEEASNITVI